MNRITWVGLLVGLVVGGPVVPMAAAAVDFGDASSETLTVKAWAALEAGDYGAVEAYTKRCIDLYGAKALEQQRSLQDFAPRETASRMWALNDVAACRFIRGKTLLKQNDKKAAREEFTYVIDSLGFAQVWDPKGWYWKVAEASKDALLTMDKGFDFGDYTSQTLTTKAWLALEAGDYEAVEAYTTKCIKLYEAEARKQQTGLKAFASSETAFNNWALNDVATCYFIRGDALMAEGKRKDAQPLFQKVIDEFGFAQCWDPKGWFWKVAVAARGRVNQIIAELETEAP